MLLSLRLLCLWLWLCHRWRWSADIWPTGKPANRVCWQQMPLCRVDISRTGTQRLKPIVLTWNIGNRSASWQQIYRKYLQSELITTINEFTCGRSRDQIGSAVWQSKCPLLYVLGSVPDICLAALIGVRDIRLKWIIIDTSNISEIFTVIEPLFSKAHQSTDNNRQCLLTGGQCCW